MPKPRSKPLCATKRSLVGTWACADEFESDVEYIISTRGSAYKVRAVDRSDNEEADVFELNWDKERGVLSFATYWNATGRFVRCQLLAQSNDQLDLTYTVTAKYVLQRKAVRCTSGSKSGSGARVEK